MRNFKEIYTRALASHDPCGVMDAFAGSPAGPLRKTAAGGLSTDDVQASVIALLLAGANDIHAPRIANTFGKYSDQWKIDTLRLAAIGMKRDDIAPLTLERGITSRDYPMLMTQDETSGLCYSKYNENAHERARLDFDVWNGSRIALIKRALDKGANIISLGEFDFPPYVDRDEYAQQFSRKVRALIDSYNHPVFLIAGTRHEFFARNGESNAQCANHAKIMVNEALDTGTRAQAVQQPIDHPKFVSAEKLGERLTPVPKSEPRFYETTFGRIGVLICVDAYNPSVIFSLINARDSRDSKRLDFVIVPAYNNSRKLYYACQLLSLTCETVVMLVDACERSNRQPARCQLFIAGRTFDGLTNHPTDSEQTIGEIVDGSDLTDFTVWQLNMNFVRECHSGTFEDFPLLRHAWPYRTSLMRT